MTRTVISGSAGGSGSGGTTVIPSTGNWATGTFGIGQLMTFSGAGSYTFVIPSGTTSIRVRCFGAGGAGGNNTGYSGGAGGGFSLGTFTVTSGSSHTVTVGAGGYNGSTGGSSSFGSLISATGGTGGGTNTSYKSGGNGSGGTVNYLGGGAQGTYSGGGGVACLFGPGNPGTYGNGGDSIPSAYDSLGATGGAGGGFGKNSTVYTSNYKGFSLGTFGMIMTGAEGRQQSPESAVFAFSPAQPTTCVDLLGTGPGGVAPSGKGFGINGGGGFGGNDNFPGQGGWPGGGGGSGGGSASWRNGANGCVVVEY